MASLDTQAGRFWFCFCCFFLKFCILICRYVYV
jgi:hypothetical protein